MQACVDGAVQGGGRVQEDRRSGQMSFLGDFNQEAAEDTTAHAPDLSDLDEAVKLKLEKETLGFYVSSHPLSRHKDIVGAYSTARIAELAEAPRGQDLVLGCILHGINFRMTRNGNKMAQMTAEDLTGKVRALVFPKNLEKCQTNLVEDKTVFLVASLDTRSEDTSLIVSDIVPLRWAHAKFARFVEVSVDTQKIDEEVLLRLRDICGDYGGRCPVYLHCRDNGSTRTIRVGRRSFVTPSDEMIAKIESLLGTGSVVVR